MPPTRIERFISGRKEPKRKSHKTHCPRWYVVIVAFCIDVLCFVLSFELHCSKTWNFILFLIFFFSEREKGLDRGTSNGSGEESDEGMFPPSGPLLTKRTFTNSQLSLVSASLEWLSYIGTIYSLSLFV